MWEALSRALGVKPPPPKKGEALAVPVAMTRPAPGEPAHAAALLFSPALEVKGDPVFLSRSQWRLMELLYDGVEPTLPVEVEAMARFRAVEIDPAAPVTYHLSDGFAHRTPLYVANVAVTPSLYDAGFDFGNHDGMLRVRYDLSGPRPTAELVPELPDPMATARGRLSSLLRRGARFAWAELAQANYQLYADGHASAACMVFLTFDFTVKPDELGQWRRKIYPLKFTNPEDPVLREAVWPLEASERGWYYHRRTALPKALTGGRAVYLADLWVHRPFIDGRFLLPNEVGTGLRRVPVLAENNESGWSGIELVPFNEVDDYRRRASERYA